MSIVALFTIAPKLIQPNGTAEKWINKSWYVYTMEYYSAMGRNEVLTYAPIWMKLGNAVLSERSQTQKDTYCMITCI